MNELVYSFRDNNVRVVEIEGEIWFLGNDVASILGYKRTGDAIAQHVEEDESKTLIYKAFGETPLANLWGINDFSNKTLINESGVYSLIFGSRLESAKEFKRWVTHEVLPSIRKTGSYQTEMNSQQLREALILQTSKELDVVKKDIEHVKTQLNERMTIGYGEQLLLLRHKNKRVETLHSDSHSHVDRNFMHRKVWSDYKRAFGVSSYRDTLVKDLPEAIAYLKAWRPLV